MESVIELIRVAIFFIGCIPAFLISSSIKLIFPAIIVSLLLLLFAIIKIKVKKIICFICIIISSFLTNMFFMNEQNMMLEEINQRTYSSLFGMITLILLLIYIGLIISSDKKEKKNTVNEDK